MVFKVLPEPEAAPQLVPAGVAHPHLVEPVDVDVLHQRILEQLLQLSRAVDRGEQRPPQPRVVIRVGQLVTETGRGPLQVTMSLGIATFPDDGKDKARLVEVADACLYLMQLGEDSYSSLISHP